MAIAQREILPEVITYEDYLTEGEVFQRYDIIDGARIVTNPTRRHQNAAGAIYEIFRNYQRASRRGKTYQPPCDILIREAPLRTRQPDALFMSNDRVALNPPEDDPAPLNPAPELIVEVRSPSDTEAVLNAKIADFCSVGVLEGWIVDMNSRTVEVLRLSPFEVESVRVYTLTETALSLCFPDLKVPVKDIFAE